MNALGPDLRHALRGLARSPGFALSVVLVARDRRGANAAVFSVASALLLRPLPYADAERLVILWNRSPGLGIAEDWFSTAQYFDIKTAHRRLSSRWRSPSARTTTSRARGSPSAWARFASPRTFSRCWGRGRRWAGSSRPPDDVPGTTGAAVLGHATWMRRFGGDPGAVGRTIVLNGQPYEIVGVLEQGFDVPREVMPTLGGAEHAEVLLPLPLDADAARVRNREDYNILGKLKPGVSVGAGPGRDGRAHRASAPRPPRLLPAQRGAHLRHRPPARAGRGDVRQALLILDRGRGFRPV